MASLYFFIFAVFLDTISSLTECNHYYDKPIDVCFSAYSSTGLLSFKYFCSFNSTTPSITFQTFNNTDNCNENLLIDSISLYNLTADDINATESNPNPFVSCRGYKSCPFFRGRYYITKILTDAPTIDPTVYPSTEASSINGNISLSPYLLNETCARTRLNDYYQEVVYLIDICLPYNNASNASAHNNNSIYISNECHENPFGIPISISRSLYLNSSCNDSLMPNTFESMYNNGECSNNSDMEYILFDAERPYFKFSILECNYVLDAVVYSSEYLFYEFDLIASFIIWIISSIMLIVYTFYICFGCRTVKQKEQYKETGIFILDDNFSESRLSVAVFQWFALFSLWLNSSFGVVNAWSVADLEDPEHCNLMMSALDLSWHWGKGFLYLSLMSRIVLIMEGLSSDYEIPTKILKVFAFEIVAYFMLTPILDLVSTRADHRLYSFIDERSSSVLTVCGEVIEYWISFLLCFGDLLLCSTTIGVYLYALGELVMNPIQNQKLIDHLIRYAIFSIFPSVWIMIGNGLWGTNYFSIARYMDTVFTVFSIMFMLTMCSSCYLQCCSSIHKRMRRSYITSFMEFKEKLIIKELNEIKNNPKYVLKSYDKTFDEKLSAILSPKNLAQNKSMETYRQNMEIHSINSTIRSKKKQRKIQKRMRKQILRATVNLDDRDLNTIKQMLTFKNNDKFIKRDESKQDTDREYTETEQTKSKSNKHKKNGLLAHLDPASSTLPQSLTIAIHASVVETTKHKKDSDKISEDIKETIRYKTAAKMQDIWTKVDTYYDENIITFCRRSPTIYPGIAYKLTKSERFALRERQDEIEGNEYSKSVDHSDSADSDDDQLNGFEKERIWPNASRKYGQRASLDDIYGLLADMNDTELDKIWDWFDTKKKRKIDYKQSLVKLLGALFLLYFRKKIYGKNEEEPQKEDEEKTKYVKINEEPPRFDELEPLLIVLAKYIRDSLRKKRRKCLKKTDFQRNFMSKYLKDAIEKRSKALENRTKSLEKALSMTPFGLNDNDNDRDVEQEEEKLLFTEAEMAFLNNKELEQRIEEYVPRESANKYEFKEEEEDTKEKKMKIDEGMEELQKKRQRLSPRSRDIDDDDDIQIDDILIDIKAIQNDSNDNKLKIGDDTPQTATTEISMDIDALVAHIVDDHEKKNIKHQLKIGDDTPQTTTTEMSMDIDALVADIVDNDDEKKQIKDEQISMDIEALVDDIVNNDSDEKKHVKDNDGTEIINVDVITPRKGKVVIIDENQIKTQETLHFDEDLLNSVVDAIDDDLAELEHKQNDTVVVVQHSNIQKSSVDWHIDAQLMDDVLDVTFAVDDSDEESP